MRIFPWSKKRNRDTARSADSVVPDFADIALRKAERQAEGTGGLNLENTEVYCIHVNENFGPVVKLQPERCPRSDAQASHTPVTIHAEVKNVELKMIVSDSFQDRVKVNQACVIHFDREVMAVIQFTHAAKPTNGAVS